MREGAKRMLAAALEADVQAYLVHVGERDAAGRRLMVRNGPRPPAAGDHGRRAGGGGRAASG